MLKARGKAIRDQPLLFTNPFYSSGPRTQLKNTINALPSGVYSVEARDLALEKKRNRERLRTGALSKKQLRLKAVKLAQMKSKWLNAIKKLTQSKGLADELAQDIHSLTETNRQWQANSGNVADLESRLRREIDAAMPEATVSQKSAALSLYKTALEMANDSANESGSRRRRGGLFGRGLDKLLRVPRIFEITEPESKRMPYTPEINMDFEREKQKWREGMQEGFRDKFFAKHGVAPKNDDVKEAFPNTAEPLIAVSTPKANPTMMKINKLKSISPFILSHW